ncbi:amino acid adenylation domain-containing protein [Actinoplanes couchii]|uniref:Carrier domain-containing protein n=1 Tax=Actinoplanes couchii TaxID=403638 RepID=A0ABQ3XTE1_9ACTN|nr:amino acid adenylation domain-containing protein [Actinoplanes couchii]MDR6324145.1 amino acid adenylation domain-containing protein [Actinoplanes couchii]GID61763.1 hypothetical protein Aco03nite_101670 [Actinoplanes couchii]
MNDSSLLHDRIAGPSGAVAVSHAGRRLTYRELHATADRIAAELVRRGYQPGTPVGLCLDDPLQLVPAVVGVLRAGCAYLPLGADWPVARVAGAVRRVGVPVVLAAGSTAAVLAGGGVPVLDLDDLPIVDPVDWPRPYGASPAYLILTSGSTGEPKAVVVGHAAADASLLARRAVYPGRVGGFLWHSPAAFDSSVAGLFWTLADGGTLVVPDDEARKDPRRLLDLIRTEPVTHVLALPRVWRGILSLAEPVDLARLTVVAVAGEAVPAGLAAEHAGLCTAPLWNEYGPAEGSVWATVRRIDPAGDGADIPIGTARPGLTVTVRHEDLRPCAPGEIGEIWLSGPGLAQGYAAAPRLTAERFLPDPSGHGRAYRTGDLAEVRSDGELLFRGRIDDQVKVSGIRVEPAEVERALLDVRGVIEAAVVGQSAAEGRTVLAAFLVLADGQTRDAVREAVGARLPAALVPARISVVDGLPRNTNGKVDRRKLAGTNAEPAAGPVSAPSDPVRESILRTWQEVLRDPSLTVDTDLFAAGGDSITAVMICGQLGEAGLTVSPLDVYEARTPAALADMLAGRAPTAPAAARAVTETAVAGGADTVESVALTPVQHWFADTQPVARDHWNLSVGATITGPDPAAVRRALVEVLDRHPILTARFEDGPEEADRRFVVGSGSVPVSIEFVAELHDEETGELIAEWQRNLSLTEGPVARLIWFEADDPRQARFVLICHHMVFDAVSLRVVLDELAGVLGGRRLGTPASWQTWVRHHTDRIIAGQYDRELPYWLATARVAGASLPGVQPGCEGDARRVTHRLGGAPVAAFVRAVGRSPELADRMLLAAVLRGFGEAYPGLETLGIDVEGHGRPAGAPGSGSVGWFTSFHPVAMNMPTGNDPAGAATAVREALDSVPGTGLGFLALAYGRPDLAGSAELRKLPAPLLRFNYLGRVESRVRTGETLLDVDLVLPGQRDPAAQRRTVFELDCALVGDELVMAWAAAEEIPAETLRRLVEAVRV